MASIEVLKVVDHFLLKLFADLLFLKIVVDNRHCLVVLLLLLGLVFDDDSDFVDCVREQSDREVGRYDDNQCLQ